MSDKNIFITQNKLIELVRFELRWDELLGDLLFEDNLEVEVENSYPLTLDDLETALENMVEDNISMLDFYMLWYVPVTTHLYKALLLDEILAPKAQDLKYTEPSAVAESDEDMIRYIFRGLAEIEYIINMDNSREALEPALNINEMLDAIDLFYENREKPLLERKFTDFQKLDFLAQWDNNMMLEDAAEEVITLFRNFTDDLTSKNNFFAIRIKAYACYEGNAVYKQDNKEAAKLLEILWKEFNFAYAANTLGYIYYYGRLDKDGKPDYEKAFFYYSVASTYGIIEAKYKLSDMFFNGYYVAQNKELAKDILMELYGNLRFRFENGDFACEFADVALRVGRLFESMQNDDLFHPDANQMIAYIFYMQADFAIKKRIETVHQHFDRKVQENIERALKSAREFAKPTNKSTFHSDTPTLAREFIGSRGGCSYGVHFKPLKSGNLKVEIERLTGPDRSNEIPDSMICMPWFEHVELSHKLSFILEGILEASGVTPDESVGYLIDNIEVVTDPGSFKMIFSASIDTVAQIEATSIKYTKPKKK